MTIDAKRLREQMDADFFVVGCYLDDAGHTADGNAMLALSAIREHTSSLLDLAERYEAAPEAVLGDCCGHYTVENKTATGGFNDLQDWVGQRVRLVRSTGESE